MVRLRRLGLSLLVILILAGPGLSASVRARLDEDGVQRAVITARSYSFSPDHLILRVNIPVELTVSRTSWLVPHNIVSDSPQAGIDFSISLSTSPRTISFTPTSTGAFPFYCDKRLFFFKSHREKGMEGVFEVVE